MINRHYSFVVLLGLAFGGLVFAMITSADHSWGGYHWARTQNPFTLTLGDNVNSSWDGYLQTASADWGVSSVLDTTIAAGSGGKNCRASAGRVEVCNNRYGRTGWLGVASIWISGSHITKGVVKMNDTYFAKAPYNSTAWKNLVMCQEVGHTFGLDHQDENFGNTALGTCMDYSGDPTPNQHPNAHDYEMLETIYAHLDTTTTVAQTSSAAASAEEDSDDPRAWGKEVRGSRDARASVFVKDLGNGQSVVRHVFWAEPRGHVQE